MLGGFNGNTLSVPDNTRFIQGYVAVCFDDIIRPADYDFPRNAHVTRSSVLLDWHLIAFNAYLQAFPTLHTK